jgi:osmoprotectant transport system substrate-binding protein
LRKLLLLVATLLSSLSFACESRCQQAEIVVASKLDAEGELLGTLIATAVESLGISVERKMRFGPTKVLRAAILRGDIHIYPEYTGNGELFFGSLGDPVWNEPEQAFNEIRAQDDTANNLVWLTHAEANNIWAIATKNEISDHEKITTLQDFSSYVRSGKSVKLACSSEFRTNPNALQAIEAKYQFHLHDDQFVEVISGDTIETIKLVDAGKSNFAMVYGTDGAAEHHGMRILLDNLNSQVAFQPAPVIRKEILEKYPQIKLPLQKIFSELTGARLKSMNSEVDTGKKQVQEIVNEFISEMQ